jgi:hypothetical protein
VQYPWLCRIPHKAEQYFAVGVSERNKMPGLCVVSRAMISVLDGPCHPVFSCFVLRM